MKKLFTLCLAVLLAMPAFAVTGEGLSGNWLAETISVPSQTFEPMLFYSNDASQGMYGLGLNGDGTGVLVRGASNEAISYTDTSITVGGTTYQMQFADGKIRIAGLEDPNDVVAGARYDFTFSQNLSYSLLPDLCEAESADALSGTYLALYMQFGSKISNVSDEMQFVAVAADSVNIMGSSVPVRFENGILAGNTSEDAGNSMLSGCARVEIRPCEAKGAIALDLLGDGGELKMRVYCRDVFLSAGTNATSPDISQKQALPEQRTFTLVESGIPKPGADDVILDIPEGAFERIGLDISDMLAAAKISGIQAENIHLVSLSPSGRTGLAFLDYKIPMTYCDGQYRVVYPSVERGFDDVNSSMKFYFYNPGIKCIGAEGVRYSPDGRYAFILNNGTVLKESRHIDPVLIDLETGEAFLPVIYGGKVMEEGFGNVMSADFTQDGTGLYYVVRKMQHFELRLIDIETLNDSLIVKMPDGLINTIFGAAWYFPNICQTRDGSFLVLSDTADRSQPQAVTCISTADGIAHSIQPYALPATTKYFYTDLLQYSAASNKGLVVSKIGSMMNSNSINGQAVSFPDFFCCFNGDSGLSRIDGMWAIDCQNMECVRFTGEELTDILADENAWTTLSRYAHIYSPRLSPDGNHVLMLATYYPDGSMKSERVLLMLDLNDMSLQQVGGLDANAIIISSVMGKYNPCMSWSGDTLFVDTQEGILSYTVTFNAAEESTQNASAAETENSGNAWFSALAGLFQPSPAVENSSDLLDTIQERGSIVVAMEGTWMPWTYHDAVTGELTGFDYEVAKAVAAKLGVEAQFEECPWDSIFAGIGSRYDICVNGVDWSAERAENYTLSKPYAYNYPILIVRTDSDITSFEDLKGKTTANMAYSTYAALAESYGATNQPVDDLNQTLQLLIDNRIDATVNSADTFNEYMTNNPDAPLKIAACAECASSVVIVMPKGEKATTLEEAINRAIDALRQDGTLSALSVKYFGIDMTMDLNQ